MTYIMVGPLVHGEQKSDKVWIQAGVRKKLTKPSSTTTASKLTSNKTFVSVVGGLDLMNVNSLCAVLLRSEE